MKNISSFKKNVNVFKVHKFSSSIHKELFSNRKIIDEFNKKKQLFV